MSELFVKIVMFFAPNNALEFIKDNIAIELFYVLLQFAAIIGLFCFVRSSRKAKIVIYAIALFVLIDSFLMWQASTYFSGRYNNKIYPDVQPVASLLKESRMPERLHVIFPSFLFEEGVKPAWREWDMLLTGNTPLYYGAPLLSGMAVNLVPRYISDFNKRFGLNADANEVDVDFSKVSLLGASKVILLKKEHAWNANYILKAEGNGYHIYEASKSGPRFYLTERISSFNFDWNNVQTDPQFDHKDYDPISISFVAETDIDATMRPFLHADGDSSYGVNDASYGNDFFSSRAGKITLKKYDWEHVDFEANVLRPSLMVMTDNWYPGWKVFVDSKERRLIRTNYIYRGVWLEAGKHTISFKFDNIFVKIGRVLSVMGLISIIVYGIYYNYGRRKI